MSKYIKLLLLNLIFCLSILPMENVDDHLILNADDKLLEQISLLSESDKVVLFGYLIHYKQAIETTLFDCEIHYNLVVDIAMNSSDQVKKAIEYIELYREENDYEITFSESLFDECMDYISSLLHPDLN